MRIGTLRDGAATLPALIEGERAYRLDDVLGAMGGVPVAVPDGADAATILAGPALSSAARAAVDALPDLITRGAAPSYPLYILGPPVPRPGKIVCAGRNYAEHAKELGNDIPPRPILFAKLATSVRGQTHRASADCGALRRCPCATAACCAGRSLGRVDGHHAVPREKPAPPAFGSGRRVRGSFSTRTASPQAFVRSFRRQRCWRDCARTTRLNRF